MSRRVVGGKYRLVRKIGDGGMGEVWIAVNQATGAEVAVKMVRETARREDAGARFRHEARLAAKLAHRGIVRIFDLVEEQGALVLVMELLKGETLERHLERRGPLQARDALAITLPLLSALAHAHSRGIVHRDVTPANVFLALDPDGFVGVKLLDFGIARTPASGDRHTVDGRALGTPRYMAPERVREEDTLDGRSDVFSVGVVLYEMVTGTCPFAAATPAASLAAVLEAVVDPDPRIDARLWLELRRALSKQPYERPETAEAMARGLLAASGETDPSLSEILRTLPVIAHGANGSRDRTRTVGGHSIGVALGLTGTPQGRIWATAAAAFVVGGALTLWTTGRGHESAVRESPTASSTPPLATAPEVILIASTVSPPSSAMAPVPALSTSPSSSPETRPAVRRRHAKPVATTPGF